MLVALGATIAALAPASALGHGGTYRDPGRAEVPPDSREPSDPPATPDAGTLGGTFAGRAPSGTKATAWAQWPRWWGCNQDAILGLRTARRRFVVTSRGLAPRGDAPLPVSLDAIRTRITPPLRALLADPKLGFDIRAGAAIGLAKTGDVSIAPELRRLVLDEDRDVHRSVKESAALALGLLEDASPATHDLLVEFVRGGGRDDSFARPFAAISLGLLGDADGTIDALLDVVSREEPGQDVQPACLLALGLVADERAIPDLVAIVRTGRSTRPGAAPLGQLARSYAVAALGMIGKPGDRDAALDAVTDLVHRHHDAPGLDMRRSAVIALGRIAAHEGPRRQARAADLLRDLAGDGGAEQQERLFALTALGRLAAAASDDASRVRSDAVAFLVGELRTGSGLAPAYASLALGLVGRAVGDEGGAAPERTIRVPLRIAFGAEENVHMRGAFALASGLVRDPLAADALLDVLRDQHADHGLRGWCALALGMIGDSRAAEPIRATLRTEIDRELRIQCATAAGLLGDPASIDDLLAILRDPDVSQYELGSAALALGRIGDERAIGALVDIAVDANDRYPDLTRGLAVVALGQLGDPRDLPTLARLTTDLNYRAQVPAIAELLTIL